jgi:hypothetical protein
MGLSDAQARAILEGALRELGYPDPKNRRVLQGLAAVARLESGYGKLRNNWGSIQCKDAPPCAPDCMELQDTHEDGTPYRWCYRTWETPEAGARAFSKTMLERGGGIVRRELERGTYLDIATAMRKTGYFEARLEKYASAIDANGKEIARSLKEPYLLKSRRGSDGTAGTVLAVMTGVLLWVTLQGRKG